MLEPDPIGPEEIVLAALVALFALFLMTSHWIRFL